MLKTRFIIHEFEEWVLTYMDFEEKIEIFQDMNLASLVTINNYIDEHDFVIEIVINKREIK
tara:strand:+ start:437 stop:619 length:183 start_codon:yes stop_codon:yes gene_type:complete